MALHSRGLGLRSVAAPRLVAFLAGVLVLLLGLTVLGCGGDPPAEETLSNLGARVGEAKLDETDFPALIESFAVPEYATSVQGNLANYQLYLTAKAAHLALNQPEPPDLVQVDKDQGGDDARVSFIFTRKEGLFAVADISKIDVELTKTEQTSFPWRIRRITLAR